MLLTPHFEPDVNAATGMLMSTLMKALHQRGHDIDVVTSLPFYQQKKVEEGWQGRPWRVEDTEMGRIIRVWPFPSDKSNIPLRALGFLGFSGLVAAAAQTLKRPDVVMALSPPIFLGEAGWLIAKRHRVPLVFNVQDIFPDVAREVGVINNPKLLSALARHERSIYQRADAITVLSQDQANNVSGKLEAGSSTVEIIKNFADIDGIKPQSRHSNMRRKLGLADEIVAQYSGNLGFSQPFDLIRQAADAFADRPDVHFVINGEGAAAREIARWASQRSNVSLTGFVAAGEVADALATADLHLIPLKAGLARSSTPSKLYGILAAGRPSLASIDRDSEVWTTLAEAKAGRSVEPGNPAAFLIALKEMLADKQELQVMGKSGRQYVETKLSPASQAEAYEKLFRRLSQ